MKLKRLILKNFRGYESLELDFDEDINVIIGKNDIGKSTIIEALEIFFNGDSKDAIVKADIQDCNIYCSEKEMTIGACFEVKQDEKIIIDSTNPIDLREEYLLNKEGYLEIYKTWNCSKDKLGANDLKIYINANYPDCFKKELPTLKNKDLIKLYEEIQDLDGEINKTINASLRNSLYKHYINENTQFEEKLIDIKSIEGDKNIWDRLRSYFPLFFLFQSDRSNSDSDSEVQNPLKVATKKVIEDMKRELENIEKHIDEAVSKIGEETIEKLKDFDPEIAKRLKTNLKYKSSWDSIFKYDLESDDGIPLNKRGSGVKRLILLSYFRAEAERISNNSGSVDIIYAIEEPETSQHPNFQKMIMESLIEIGSDEKHQVIVTTHTPEIAKMVNKQSLILISKNGSNEPVLIKDEELRLKEIAKTLGVLPTIDSKLVVCVEGDTDANFLRIINKNIEEFRNIIDLEEEEISFIPMIGSNLMNWVNRNYLDKSNVVEFHLYDGDKEENKKIIDDIKKNNDGRRFGALLSRREIENYIPIDLIEEEFSIELSPYKENWNNFDVSMYIFGKYKLKEVDIKRRLTGKAAKKITKESLIKHNCFDEIENWFMEIGEIYHK